MRKFTISNLCFVFIIVLSLLSTATKAQQYNTNNPPPATPPSNVNNVQDRDQMLYQLNITFPANPQKLLDPNRPGDAYPKTASNPQGSWTNAGGYTVES